MTAETGPLTTDEVRQAAERLVAAFAATDTQEYFACFSPTATFVFHPEARRLDTRAAYETLWRGWLADGWRVVSCTSSEPLVQLLGEVAVLTHTVDTVTETNGERLATRERETIVFARVDGAVLAVHEHLSPVPEQS